MNIHYALQTCDIASNQTQNRITCTSKTEISKRCVTSFFNSVKFASEIYKDITHVIKVFDDRSTLELLSHLYELKSKFTSDNVKVEIEQIDVGGVMPSIGACYDWLETQGSNLVYQVQDDYLFHPHAIIEMISVFIQLKTELDTEVVITPYNQPSLWMGTYRNKIAPRTIFPGSSRYWLQTYDVSCSFMCSHDIFMQIKDLRTIFLSFPSTGDKDGNLENRSLNYMFTQRGILGILAFNSLALHIQGELEKDPYIKWETWWKEYTK
jgi:hypothetical protein